MPKTAYQVSPMQTQGIATSAGQGLRNVSQSIQNTIEPLPVEQQRMVFLRVATWCMENLQHLNGGEAETAVG